MPPPSNPATLADVQQDSRIPALPPLVAGADRASLLVPVYDPETDTTYRTRLLGEDATFDSNAVIGGPKLVQYRSSQLFGVPAEALTLDRLSSATIVPGTMATVDNPSDTPLSATKPPQQYVATRTAPGTPGAVLVPAYIGAAQANTVPVVWVEVATGAGPGGPVAFADVTGNPRDNVALDATLTQAASAPQRSFQVTASSFAGFADLLLTNPAARLDALDPFFNAAGVQGQLLLLGGQPYRAYADAVGAVATLNSHLAAFWAEFGAQGRALLRLRVVPASPAIVAHAQVFFTHPPALTPQPLHPHNSGFRLYGTQFALSAYDWNHLAGCLASGGTLSSNANYGNATATGSPRFENTGSGLRALFTARHNQANSYDLLGFTASPAPNPNGANFAAAFQLVQGAMVWAMRGSTKVAELPYNGELLSIELWDDGIRWYVGSTLLYYDPTPPAETSLHLGATFHTDQAAWVDVQAGGQTANPR